MYMELDLWYQPTPEITASSPHHIMLCDAILNNVITKNILSLFVGGL